MYYIIPTEEAAEGIINSATDIDNLNSKFANMRPQLQDSRSIAGTLIHVEPDENLLLELTNIDRLNDIMTVIDYSTQLPQVFKIKDVYEKIQEFLEKFEFDRTDGLICTISPFLGLYRGFMIEIFKLEDGLKFIKEITFDGKVGLDSYIKEIDSIDKNQLVFQELIQDEQKGEEQESKVEDISNEKASLKKSIF